LTAVEHLIAARGVALTHFAFIAFLIAGGPIGLRYARARPVHVAAIATALAINLTGSDCPLTVLEKRMLQAGGHRVYEGGFISHYLVEPVHPAGIDGRINLLLLSAWIVPTAAAYALRARRPKTQRLS
jgi:hypothetical protein